MNVSGVGAGLSAARDKGLTSTGGGWRFICEFEYCPRDWKTEVVPASEIATLAKLNELHTLQVHKTKEEQSGEMFKEKEKYVEATKVRVIPAQPERTTAWINSILLDFCPSLFVTRI